ncbi:MAG TPA: glycosyltransferase family 39 protein, partial [Oligoflexia bacterium]|nr:glycosyltransferase family 39 protein [Oligoflexia bacterium]
MKKLSTVFIRDEWLLLGVALFIYFAGIWDQSMPTPDGAHRASMAREVLERATWFPIYYQGHALADHPPLYVWLVALVFKLFGVGDLQFIMVNRVLVTIGVLLLYFAGKSIFEKKGQALFACLMLLVTVGFYQGSVAGNIEPLLNIFLIGAF